MYLIWSEETTEKLLETDSCYMSESFESVSVFQNQPMPIYSEVCDKTLRMCVTSKEFNFLGSKSPDASGSAERKNLCCCKSSQDQG